MESSSLERETAHKKRRHVPRTATATREDVRLRRVPILSSLLRRSGPISRVKRPLRCGLRVPEVALRPTLSLLTLSGSTRLRLCARTLREPSRATAIERARLSRGSPATLWASRRNATDVLGAAALGVRLERRFGRRVGPPRAKTLLVLVLVLVRIQRLAIVSTGQNADAAEAPA